MLKSVISQFDQNQNFRKEILMVTYLYWFGIIALAFGLFHGLGFAGALAEVGLPQQEIPLALLMFNVGVEIGQLGFVAILSCCGPPSGCWSFAGDLRW